MTAPFAERWVATAPWSRLWRGSLAAALALAAVIAWVRLDRAPLAPIVPVQAAEFLRHEALEEGVMFNHQNFGGYLGWRLHRLVFWDGRNLLFAPLLRQVGEQDMATVRKRFPFDHLVITEHEMRSLGPQLDRRSWGLVFWDDWSAVFVERAARYEQLLEDKELQLLPPFGGIPWLARTAQDEALAAAVRGELARVLEDAPRCQRAFYFLARVSLYRGEADRARGELERAAAIARNPIVENALRTARGNSR